MIICQSSAEHAQASHSLSQFTQFVVISGPLLLLLSLSHTAAGVDFEQYETIAPRGSTNKEDLSMIISDVMFSAFNIPTSLFYHLSPGTYNSRRTVWVMTDTVRSITAPLNLMYLKVTR